MANSLLSITPHEVSRNLKGYSVMFYGAPKSGKTTIASQFPHSLLLAFEKGYSALPGVMAMPVNSWGEFKRILGELRDPAVKERFETVVIDTADIAYSFCEKYVCSQAITNEQIYDSIPEIPYGKGYKLAMSEFDEAIRKVLQMGYGLVIISHAQDKTFKDENKQDYSQIIPTLDTRARLVCERACDIIGYSRGIETEDGVVTKLFLRGTPRFIAGSRFKYTPEVITFTYDNLVNAIVSAIDKEAEVSGFVTTDYTPAHIEEQEYDFSSLMIQFQDKVDSLMKSDPEANSSKIVKIVENYLGKGRKVGDCNESQANLIDLIIQDLNNL